jgi:hypothetical protein
MAFEFSIKLKRERERASDREGTNEAYEKRGRKKEGSCEADADLHV